MLAFITSICLGGLACLALALSYLAYVGFMYIIYRCTGGKMKFRKYVKYW